jgi:uncharacterized protein YdhG (YjbR/CyaY superfamily)
MSDAKTKPTDVSVSEYLATVSESRRDEARLLIDLMQKVSGHQAMMWGPSIIGFGSQHYAYETGREGDMPRLAFSPRKAAITVYFSEGFDRYASELAALGKYKTSVSCLYINKLADVDMSVLERMIAKSHEVNAATLPPQTSSVDAYIASIPAVARPKFDELRTLVKGLLPRANEVPSYGIIGYKIDAKRARVFISGWKDHLAMYPIPKDEALQDALQPYIKGKGTLWFRLDEPLPRKLIERIVKSLVA